MNTKLKKAAMTKARREGTTLTAVINAAVSKYVQGRLKIEAIDKDYIEGMADLKAGKYSPAEEVFTRLGL